MGSAQHGSTISVDNVSKVKRLGSTSQDMTMIGPTCIPGHYFAEFRKSEQIWDDRSNRLVQQTTRSTSVVDVISFKEIQKLEGKTLVAAVSKQRKKGLLIPAQANASSFYVSSLTADPLNPVRSDDSRTCRLKGFGARVVGAAFHPHQNLIAVTVWQHDPAETGCIIGFSNIRLFTYDGMLVRQFEQFNGGVSEPAFSCDGKLLIVTNRKSKQTEMIDIKSGKVAMTLPKFSRPPLIKFHPQKNWVAVLSSESCEIWNTSTGEKVSTLETEMDKSKGAIAWSSSGDLLLVAAAGKLTFWKSGTGPRDEWIKLRELPLFYSGVTKLSITHEGSRVITESKSLDQWNRDARRIETWGVDY